MQFTSVLILPDDPSMACPASRCPCESSESRGNDFRSCLTSVAFSEEGSLLTYALFALPKLRALRLRGLSEASVADLDPDRTCSPDCQLAAELLRGLLSHAGTARAFRTGLFDTPSTSASSEPGCSRAKLACTHTVYHNVECRQYNVMLMNALDNISQ